MREEQTCTIACRITLDAQAAKDFKEKIDDEYRVNIILDDLPVVLSKPNLDGSPSTIYKQGFRVGFKGSYVGWFSIINSLLIMLIFLCAMVAMIIFMIRTLYKDIAIYNQFEGQDEAAEETGWKLILGDVFRPPLNLSQ